MKLSKENESACHAIPKIKFDPTALSQVLVKRGDCQFSDKVKNVQMAGGKGVIIYDTQVSISVESIIMMEDTYDSSIIIPSMMVSKKDGLAMAEYAPAIQNQDSTTDTNTDSEGDKNTDSEKDKNTDSEKDKNTDLKQELGLIKAMISYDELPKKDKVDQEMIITPLDPAMMNFFKSWYPVQNLVKNETNFRPIFYFQFVQEADLTQQKTKDQSEACFSGGRQCMKPLQNETGKIIHPGINVMYHILYQLCILNKQDVDKWITYVYRFGNECNTKSEWSKACAYKLMEDMQIKDTVDRCQEDSFENAPGKKQDALLDDNMLLRQEREQQQAKKVPYYPAVFVNGKLLRGDIDRNDLFDDICEGFSNKPDQCTQILNEDDPTKWQLEVEVAKFDKMQLYNTIWYVVGISLLVALVLGYTLWMCFFRKMMKRMMDEEINSALNEQFEFNEKKDTDDINNWHKE